MDPITLIVTAIAAGATLGLKDTASAAVRDAYVGLKALVKKRLGGGATAEFVVANHEESPEAWQEALKSELAKTGADADPDLIAAAQAFLDLVGKGQGQTGMYMTNIRNSQGVQVGDHNRQDNVFNSPPAG